MCCGCSLQEELSRAQRELKRLQEEQQTQQEKWQQLLVELRGQLLDKSREVEELRLQVNLTVDTWEDAAAGI